MSSLDLTLVANKLLFAVYELHMMRGCIFICGALAFETSTTANTAVADY